MDPLGNHHSSIHAGASEGQEAAEDTALPAVDYSIKPGEKITIKLTVVRSCHKVVLPGGHTTWPISSWGLTQCLVRYVVQVSVVQHAI